MAEAQLRKTQFTYNANANLVLQTSTTVKRDLSAPTGEPETLGKFDPTTLRGQMGSRAIRERPKKTDPKKLREQREKLEETDRARRREKHDLQYDVTTVQVFPYYRPKTENTKKVFGVILHKLDQLLGGQPRELLREFAHEMLTIFKDDKSPVAKKQHAAINTMLEKNQQMGGDLFHELLQLSKRITDFEVDKKNPDDVAADQNKVGVMFEKEDEEGKGLDMDLDVQEEDSDSGDETTYMPAAMPEDFQEREKEREKLGSFQVTYVDGPESSLQLNEQEFEISPKDVDAFWLMRKIGEIIENEDEKKLKTEEVFSILEKDSRTLENELLDSLGSKNFSFAQELLKNRAVIVWCTNLKRAKSEDEKQKLRDEMKQDPLLARILFELDRTYGTAEQRASKQIRQQYKTMQKVIGRQVKGGIAGAAGAQDLSEPARWFKQQIRSQLDLESLTFQQQGHFMSTEEWKLRPGSKYTNKKGYQSIYVPAMSAPTDRKKELISIDTMPEWAQKAFNLKSESADDEFDNGERITQLNEVQSACYDRAFNNGRNLLVCAPTGAGKTNVALLTMLREIGIAREGGKVKLDEFKIVYIAPMKSLVREIVHKFTKRLSCFGIKVSELSGDVQLTRDQLMATQVIVSTPEKWDIVTRKGMDRSYAAMVKLIIMDEIHMLHDERGPVLEAIVARTIRHIEQTQEFIRLVGLSATLPNYEDVAMFIRCDPKKDLFYFDGSYRPCPLVQRFAGITSKKPLKRNKLKNELCFEYCREQFLRNNQVIVFVHSRKETINTARNIIEHCRDNGALEELLPPSSHSFDILKEEAETTGMEALKELLPAGIGIHHAGMTRDDRSLVEDLFREEHIRILVSTATLAYGVNLPAHAVIVKGTQIYNPQKGKWVEISMQDIMQMFGRAGRPNYDTTGEAYLITSYKELSYYLPLLNEQLPIESQLISKLPDALNAEIVRGAVTNLKEATSWLGYSYLFVRMLKNPDLYNIPKEEQDERLEQRRIDLAHNAAVLLDKSNLIKYDKKTGHFQVTELGRVCSHYYLTHSTVQTFDTHLKPTMSDIEIFRVFALADEFKYMGVREEEQQELNILKDKVPIPVKEQVNEASAKVNILLQAYIARLKLEGYVLMADMVYVTQSAGRIMRALFEICLKRKWAPLACRTLNLCKMIKHRMWSIETPLRQFKGRIPPMILRKIEKSTFSWEAFFGLNANEIGELVHFPEQGKNIRKLVDRVPRLELKGSIQTITRQDIKVELKIEADFKFDEKIHGQRQDFWIFVEDLDGENILHSEFFSLRKKFAQEENILSFIIPIYDPLPPQYFVRVISDSWLGSESVMPISFRHLILPQKFPQVSELLDLRPLEIECLQDNAPEAMEIYRDEIDIKRLNPIQTQVFSAFFKGDDSNVFLGAPSASGKTFCAELAIIKMLEEYPNGRCVYISPKESMAKERYREWKKLFGEGLEFPVRLLTGDNTTDTRYLNVAKIIISNPVNWDKISRRWRRKKAIQNINLFIVDDLHLMNSEGGSTLEFIISRMRYVEDQTGNNIRFIALSAPIANYDDVAQWIGVGARTRFNFPMSNRPVPLDIIISEKGSEINGYDDRQIAFLKPCYAYIQRFSSQEDPVIIFAPNRKYTRTIASDIMAFAALEENPKKFLAVQEEVLEDYIKPIKSESLKTCLRHGIGYIHEYTSEEDIKRVKLVFQAGAIQILVVERTLCWGLGLEANMTVVMGTKYWDGGEHTYVDYGLADIIKMMGYAKKCTENREVCTSVVFTHASKVEHLKKFLHEPFPVESHLDWDFADHLNAEIDSGTVETAEDAVDLLTWTFYVPRLSQNPNYYSLKAVSSAHLSNHLSEFVEQTIDDLVEYGCIRKEDDMSLQKVNGGMIASYYYIRTSTVDIFSQVLSSKRKLKDLLDILCNATEFEDIPIRQNEDLMLQRLARHMPLEIPKPNYLSSKTKANILLQTHFSRHPVSQEIKADRDKLVSQCIPLVWAMVDLLASEQWLKPTLLCLELCQMITQALWDYDSPLMQLPFFTRDICKEFKKNNVEQIFDLVELEDEERDKLCERFSKEQMGQIAKVCNTYPNLEFSLVVQEQAIYPTKKMSIEVRIEREDAEEDEELTDEQKEQKQIATPYVNCPLFKGNKTETWFLVVGDSARNKLLTLHRFTMRRLLEKKTLTFTAPRKPGKYKWKLYLMSDSYLGTDTVNDISFTVSDGEPPESSEEEEEESS